MTFAGGPKPKAVQVADALRQDIKRMKPGEKLPSQRELIARFGFASQTIQNGLAALRAEGLIVSAGNLGNFVNDASAPTADAREDIQGILARLEDLTQRVAALERRATRTSG
ncbi:winged helix-turn-helix domain-containing protein [Streptomyces erythrochromogenes]|uniref:winged helix-turn-helix domain-containing protein n=1 Tax=Streptomyces erythrochromogenes TaxID=285574 RepID=UPI0036A3DE6E